MSGKKVAIGGQLAHCRDVITLGVKRNLHAYTDHERELIYNARKIYFPSFFLYEPLHAIGKRTFPNRNYYTYFNDKIKQTRLFSDRGIPQPKTEIYSGEVRNSRILKEWEFPFIAKIPMRTSFGMGVYLVRSTDDLDAYLEKTENAYIQEYLPIDRDLRIVLINKKIILAFWRLMPEGEYRTNVFRGGEIHFGGIPERACALARKVTELCDFDNVGLDLCEYAGRYYVFEANMGYGIEGFRKAGLDYKTMLKRMVENNEI